MGGLREILSGFEIFQIFENFDDDIVYKNLKIIVTSPPTVPPRTYLESATSQLSLEKKIISFGHFNQFLQNFEISTGFCCAADIAENDENQHFRWFEELRFQIIIKDDQMVQMT